jgi:hypothetical protein
MKKQTNTNLLINSSLAVTLALAILSPVQARSAEPAAGKMMTETKMMEGCQAMKAQKGKMMAKMKEQDAKLAELVAGMNSAPTEKKTDLMAAIVTQMVAQRTAMHASKAKMDEKMMQHMMQHMQMGKESMSQCPMMKDMKGMKGMKEKSPDAHKKHHAEQK